MTAKHVFALLLLTWFVCAVLFWAIMTRVSFQCGRVAVMTPEGYATTVCAP